MVGGLFVVIADDRTEVLLGTVEPIERGAGLADIGSSAERGDSVRRTSAESRCPDRYQ